MGALLILAGLIGVYLFSSGAFRVEEFDPVDTGLRSEWPAWVTDFGRAISVAEGYGQPGAIPTTTNNPGDIFPNGDRTGFANIDDGWHALWNQVNLMFENRSSIYSSSMTIRGVAGHYTATQQDDWARNVASELGFSPETTLDEIRSSYAG